MPPALKWFKSSYSGSDGGECVEIAVASISIRIRDSKNPNGPRLRVSPATWADFTVFVATRG
ncbi:DUF397 domain-containing protein [Streptomyces sp. Ru73]|uniref:DUF397 domain-containing protein n=1 Tax=Streptomyces sp. Ru73 TaxID=2080748 RepID=UPI000CDD7846|nr:DUF397 domain-containing protein [Streptomyces sp. Ru73]POX37585.1 DUF397 domain-containing protein [Streptomyces sp. Ru73]